MIFGIEHVPYVLKSNFYGSKTKIKYLPSRDGERYTSALVNKNLSNKIYKHYGKISLRNYVSEFINNNT